MPDGGVRGARVPGERIAYFRIPLAGIDAMSARSSRTFPRHTHDQYGIGVVDSGGHASLSGRGQVEAGAGSLIFVNPGEVHDGRSIGGRPRSWRMLYLDPSALHAARADVLEGAGAGTPAFAAPVFADERLRRAFDLAFDGATRHDEDLEAVAESAILLLVAHCSRNLAGAIGRQGKSTVPIRRVRERIDADPAARLTLADLAAETGTSRFQLLRAFARQVGMTPHAYRVQQRLALARRMIRAGAALADAAAATGFCDQSHLTRAFSRQFGVSPSRYGARAA